MEIVLRTMSLYFMLLMVFRLTGKRSLAQITTFDFVLLLIISEVTGPAMLGYSYSLTNSILAILTIIVLDLGLALLKIHVPKVKLAIEGLPMVILANGKPMKKRMRKARIEEDDILSAARNCQGLENLSQIKFAVLESDGAISIIPKERQG